MTMKYKGPQLRAQGVGSVLNSRADLSLHPALCSGCDWLSARQGRLPVICSKGHCLDTNAVATTLSVLGLLQLMCDSRSYCYNSLPH